MGLLWHYGVKFAVCVFECVYAGDLNRRVYLQIKQQEHDHRSIFILYCSLIKTGIVLAVVDYSLTTSVSGCHPAVWLPSLQSNRRLVLLGGSLSPVTVSECLCFLGNIYFNPLLKSSVYSDQKYLNTVSMHSNLSY